MGNQVAFEPLGPSSPVLRLHGVPTRFSEGLTGEGFFFDPMGSWRPITDDGLYAIEAECVQLQDELAARIFGNIETYHALLPATPTFLAEAGHNSESPIGRDDFERLLANFANFPELNRFLYLYDVRALVSAVQECTKEVCQLTGEFYRILNLEPFFTSSSALEDGTRWSTSPVVTMLMSTLSFLFIRLHSLLDYLVKLAREVEQLRTTFSTYPRLACANFLFGSRKKLKISALAGTLFEHCEEIREVELLRNLLIHDGLLDDMPKAYEVIQGGVAIERFVLMPDHHDGRFDRYKNRQRFYGGEDKINLRLLALVKRFQQRQVATVSSIRAQLAHT